ncbi:MAG TPA: 16S rRNA (cytidine(1402)-2'-O)-methyltransferase [Anaeromyxobacteraceae bacterium]|nr:16S rRNA (cytidine(1402)-2'-O)-methyltransferase [Anaeromyxobacteraceae bacterium]
MATPIGNLADLSPRAAEVLRSVEAVAAEDTRRTRKLLAHVGARPAALLSLPAFDERARLGPILDRLRAGGSVALCTDAGTPGISDPGQALVEGAWQAGARVVPIPGPTAAAAALAASGLPGDRFFFAGFLPRKGASRAAAIGALARVPATVVLYEAGNRTGATLRDLAAAMGRRPAAVARELTKVHEEVARGTLEELAERFAGEVRGEVTIVVGAGAVQGDTGAGAGPSLEEELRERIRAGQAPSAVAREVARARGLRRADVYAALERIRRG